MKVYYELNLHTFQAWSGAVETLDRIRKEHKVDDLEALLEEIYQDGMDETQLNDLLRFEDQWLFEVLGIRSYDVISSELKEAESALEDLQSNLVDDLDDNGLGAEEIQDIKDYYAPQIETLESRIKELREELKDA